jgi:chromosomal replication initiation ATPase DnaA
MNALVAIALYDKQERDRLSGEEAERQQLIRDYREISLLSILEDVCKVFKVPVEKVKSKRRGRPLVVCKRIFCYLACLKTKHSLRDVAMELAFDDHTTVIYHRDTTIDFLLKQKKEFMTDWRYYLHNSKLFVADDF